MIDNPTAQATVGNIYEFVLIASERVREINRERDASGESGLPTDQYKKLEKAHLKAVREIVEGKIGREYLKKINQRVRKNKNAMV